MGPYLASRSSGAAQVDFSIEMDSRSGRGVDSCLRRNDKWQTRPAPNSLSLPRGLSPKAWVGGGNGNQNHADPPASPPPDRRTRGSFPRKHVLECFTRGRESRKTCPRVRLSGKTWLVKRIISRNIAFPAVLYSVVTWTGVPARSVRLMGWPFGSPGSRVAPFAVNAPCRRPDDSLLDDRSLDPFAADHQSGLRAAKEAPGGMA